MLDWLIVGGGIHGVHIANVLTSRCGVDRERLCLLDPHPQPLARWNRLTENVGMVYMRSPGVHHLGLDPAELEQFGRTQEGRIYARYREPYQRPAYDFFQKHCQSVVDRLVLDPCWLQGSARSLHPLASGWRVETEQGDVDARRVVLAIGRTQLRWPAWTTPLRALGAPLHHLFEDNFHLAALDLPHQDGPQAGAQAVVVGGGISAGQAALHLAGRNPGQVTLLMRHEQSEHQFDSEPCWNGPRCMRDFLKTNDYALRRQMIRAARHPGSMPKEVIRQLRQAEQAGHLQICIEEVRHAEMHSTRQMILHLGRGNWLAADRLILATGFEQLRPGHGWLDGMVEALDLPCAPCGYPIVDPLLRWRPGLHVTGPLAELELGAVSPNIRGARAAAERISQV
jgi:hypothetical protein